MGEHFRKNSAGVRNTSLKMNTHFNRGRSPNCASNLQTEGKSSAISRVDSSSKESCPGFNKMHQNQLHQENVKTKGKLQVKDVPPIENLHISKIEKGMKKIGIVHAVVDKLVIVKALEDTQQLELDSVLFLSSGNPLGQVFEKFGKHEPFYCIRFKNSEHIKSKGIVVDDEVFFVPDETDATPLAVEETAKKVNNSDTPSTSQSETLQKNSVASDEGEKDGSGKQKKEVPVVSLKVLTNGTNGVAVYIPPCSSANTGNNAYSTLPKPVQSSAVRFVTDMQQNSHNNSFSSFPNVPLLPTPPVFRPFFPNYLFVSPPCQFPSTFGSIPAQNSLEMRFPTSVPIPFPQVQQNMLPQPNALYASSVMNYRPPNLLGQISGLGTTSAPLQFPLSSHSPVSSSGPLLLPTGISSTNINPFLNPQMNFAQHGNPSLPLPAAPPVKSLQWFQGHSIRKTK